MSSLLSRLIFVALAGTLSSSAMAADAAAEAAAKAAVKKEAVKKATPAVAAPAAAAAAPAAAPAPAPAPVAKAPSDPMSPVGLWTTVDDETKKERVQVRITETNGVLSGKIVKNIDPTIDANAKCTECPDDDPRKDKPTLGMVILKDLKKDGDIYSGGTVLNAGNGKIYKAEVKVVNGGKNLEMKGKIGPFGKTQTWNRAE